MKKIDLQLKYLLSSLEKFQCPNCREPLKYLEPYSLICNQNHTFNLARPGYINLAPQLKLRHYDRPLFEARRRIFLVGFFDPLLEAIQTMMGPGKSNTLLDAGCGEGSLLSNLYHRYNVEERSKLNWYGLDAAKDGIRLAAQLNESILWIVGDLANIPMRANTCDIILNILSPANYASFCRILKPAGCLIKVVPGPDHLVELRSSFALATNYKLEDNKVLELFQNSFHMAEQKSVRYTIPLASLDVVDLLAMTPLMMHQDSEKGVDQLLSQHQCITIDLLVMKGIDLPQRS